MDVRLDSIQLGRRAANREKSVHLQVVPALSHADEYDIFRHNDQRPIEPLQHLACPRFEM